MNPLEIKQALEQIRDILWMDPETEELDPEKIQSIEMLEDIVKIFDAHGLRPQKKEPWKEVPANPFRVLVITDKLGKGIYEDNGVQVHEVDRISDPKAEVPVGFADLVPVDLGLPIDNIYNKLFGARPRLRRKKR